MIVSELPGGLVKVHVVPDTVYALAGFWKTFPTATITRCSSFPVTLVLIVNASVEPSPVSYLV